MIAGLVLAAGAGSRYGMPKALAVTTAGAPWLPTVVDTLVAGGCDTVHVALGAERGRARLLVPPPAAVVEVGNWREGLSATVRAGLAALAETDAIAAVIAPVDLPAMPPSAVARLIATGAGSHDLARAVFDGADGHPVLIGRAHWPAVTAAVGGDRGAGGYLAAHAARRVECGDLWDGADVDRRPA